MASPDIYFQIGAFKNKLKEQGKSARLNENTHTDADLTIIELRTQKTVGRVLLGVKGDITPMNSSGSQRKTSG
jgi:hypothetical protein